jgi:hypothetical protein
MAGSGSSAISQARIEVLDETGARETKSRGVLNERALGIGRLIFGWHLPFHVAQIRDARALDGKLAFPWLLARRGSLEATMSYYLVERIKAQPNIEVRPDPK